jgi:hypothetical protein
MKKTSDAMVLEHQNHIERAIVSANSVANASFKIDFDDNGKTELSYGYEPSLQDTQRLVSIVSDLPAYMNERFGVGKDFKHMSLMKTRDGLILNFGKIYE